METHVGTGGSGGRCLLVALAMLWGGWGVDRAEAEAQVEDARPGVAVFEFDNGGSYGPDAEDFELLGVGLQQMLLTELGQSTDLRIVERRTLRDLLAEQDLAVEGRVDPSTAAEIGRLVGARYVITGSFMDLYGDFRMDARIVDGETGEILRTERVRSDRADLYDLVIQMAEGIIAGVELPPLSSEVWESRRSREIPPEAVTLYSRAIALEERGEVERAVEAYQRIVDEFPEMTEAEEALRQIRGP